MKETTADRIRRMRQAKDLTQKDMEARTGIPQGTYSRYESGIVEPSAERLGKIAIALGVSIAALDPRFDKDIDTSPVASRSRSDDKLQDIERKLDALTRRLERQGAAEEQLPADLGEYAIPVRTCGVYGLAQCKAEGHLWEDVIPDS